MPTQLAGGLTGSSRCWPRKGRPSPMPGSRWRATTLSAGNGKPPKQPGQRGRGTVIWRPVRGQGQHRRRRIPHDGRVPRLPRGARRGRRHRHCSPEEGRRYPGWENQPGPVRHRPGGHAVPVRGRAEHVRSPACQWRIKLRERRCRRPGHCAVFPRHGHRRLR